MDYFVSCYFLKIKALINNPKINAPAMRKYTLVGNPNKNETTIHKNNPPLSSLEIVLNVSSLNLNSHSAERESNISKTIQIISITDINREDNPNERNSLWNKRLQAMYI